MMRAKLQILFIVLVLGVQPSLCAPAQAQHRLTNLMSNVTITFDDLPTSSRGLGNITSTNTTYQHLQFSNLRLLHTPKAYTHNLLEYQHEVLCANSAPNAVFSPNFQTYLNSTVKTPTKSRFYLNSTHSASSGGPILFNLVSLSIGPLGIVPEYPEYVIFRIELFLVDDASKPDEGEIKFGMWMFFPPGLVVSQPSGVLREYFGDEWGRNVNRMEMWAELKNDEAEDEDDAREWAFCIDDLVLEWVYA